MNDWLSKNYNELKNICNKFSTPDEVDDLLHLCIEQFIKNKKVHQIPDKEKLYFFTKIVRNQYHSKSSKYHYTYRRYQFNEIIDNDIAEIEYQEDEFNMNWKITKIGEPVTFKAGMPFMFFNIYDNNLLKDTEFLTENLWDKPELMVERKAYSDAKMKKLHEQPWTWMNGIRTGLDEKGNTIGPRTEALPRFNEPI